MMDMTATCIDLKKLRKGAVRRFYTVFEQREAVSESSPDDDEGFKREGIALVVGAEVRGVNLR